jgi:hypothetical protein
VPVRPTLVVAAVLLYSWSLVQTPARPDLEFEIGRIRGELAASVPADQQAAHTTRLDRATAALAAGRTYLAFYLMEAPFEFARAWTFAKSASTVTTYDAFVKKWTEVGPPPRAFGPAASLALARALAAMAANRGPTTYQASRPYAEDAGVQAGLYYLGDSRAVGAFAAFARATVWPARGASPSFRSIAPELAEFDAEMTTRYETMERESHPTYIQASSVLKQARALNDRGEYEGALFAYLLSRYLFAPLRGPAAADATAERIATSRASLGAGDQSVAELFLQLAEEGVSSTVPAQRRGAAAAVEDVVPAYLAAVAPAATTTLAKAVPAVTITLVRWPFT